MERVGLAFCLLLCYFLPMTSSKLCFVFLVVNWFPRKSRSQYDLLWVGCIVFTPTAYLSPGFPRSFSQWQHYNRVCQVKWPCWACAQAHDALSASWPALHSVTCLIWWPCATTAFSVLENDLGLSKSLNLFIVFWKMEFCIDGFDNLCSPE